MPSQIIHFICDIAAPTDATKNYMSESMLITPRKFRAVAGTCTSTTGSYHHVTTFYSLDISTEPLFQCIDTLPYNNESMVWHKTNYKGGSLRSFRAIDEELTIATAGKFTFILEFSDEIM